jgi:acyl-CoA synthetase (AMP-forming)/AMP-acid ligase II
MNIVEPILFQAKYHPEAPALGAQGIDIVSYARLAAQMESIARRAQAGGLQPGAVVALSIDQPLWHAAAILGLTHAGMVPVSVGMHRPPAGLKIDAVIANTRYPFVPEARRLPFDPGWLVAAPAAVPARGAPATGDEVCRIILTSGSAGDPKAVALTHKLAAARNTRLDHVAGNWLASCSRLYMQMGLAAALGYQFLTHMLSRGGTVFFAGETAENTLRAFEIFKIQAMVATPTTLAQLIAHCDRHPSIEIHLDTILTAGGQLAPALAERVRPRLCSQLITGYGATETALSATAAAHRISSIPGAAGYVTPGIRIEIVDESDRPLPAGREGIVRVASEFGVDCYIDDPAETAQVFRDGWFYPGDIGSLTADSLLVISGRQNDVLNAGGGKMAAERIEAALVAFKGINDAAVFMETSKLGVDEVWAAIVANETVDAESLRAHCRTRMPQVFVPAYVVSLDALPINTMGKVDRPRVRDLALAARKG